MPVWVAPKNGVFGVSESLIIFPCRPVVPLLRAMSFPPSQSPARAAASPSLADELERRLDLNFDDEFTLVQQPSIVSSLAQLSARGGSVQVLPEVSIRPLSVRHVMYWGGLSFGSSGLAGRPQSAPAKPPAKPSLLTKAVFIGMAEKKSLCLGFVGSTKQRFCIAPKLEGKNHCGVVNHGKSKMIIEEAAFWVPGGTLVKYPTARSDIPHIPLEGLKKASLELLQTQAALPQRWPEQFELIRNRQATKSVSSSSNNSVQDDYTMDDIQDEEIDDEQQSKGTFGVFTSGNTPRRKNAGDLGDPPGGWETTLANMNASMEAMADMLEVQGNTIDRLRAQIEELQVAHSEAASLHFDLEEFQARIGDL